VLQPRRQPPATSQPCMADHTRAPTVDEGKSPVVSPHKQ
jgi:hypothetical protein